MLQRGDKVKLALTTSYNKELNDAVGEVMSHCNKSGTYLVVFPGGIGAWWFEYELALAEG